jgi:SAM-dependent methyltransferase
MLLSHLRNAFDYSLRQLFRWRRSGLHFRNESKDKLFSNLDHNDRENAQRIARRLREDYHLQQFYNQSRAENYRENLFYLEMLERALNTAGRKLPKVIRAADIGCSHWFYVQALYALLTWWNAPEGRQVDLTGYEIDAYRVYANFYSRYDHAQAHINTLRNVHYLPLAFTPQPRQFDIITMLFPFVFIKDHTRWGLPKNLFLPEKLLADVWNSLKPGGMLIIVNQGEDEHQAEKERLKALDIKPLTAFRHDSILFHYDIPRFVLTGQKDE